MNFRSPERASLALTSGDGQNPGPVSPKNAGCTWLLQIPPVGAHPHFHGQRDGESVNFFHLLADQGLDRAHFSLGDFEDQFVVNLQSHPGFQITFQQCGVDADHGQFDQVGGGALQRSVDGGAFGKASLICVPAVDVGDGADAAVEGFYFEVAAGFLERFVDEGADASVLFKIAGDEVFGFRGPDAEILRQSEGREAVDDAEVNDLGRASMLGRDHERRNPEDLRGSEGVDVVAAAVGFDQQRIAREVGEQAEIDLRKIGGEEHVAGLGDEGGANAASELGADGDVLQIRIGGRKASGSRAGLAEGGVQASAGAMDERGQRIDVGGLQFRELAIVEDHARDGMILGESFENIDGGRYNAAFAILYRLGQIHFVEQNVAELLGGANVELHARGFVDFFRLHADLALEFR